MRLPQNDGHDWLNSPLCPPPMSEGKKKNKEEKKKQRWSGRGAEKKMREPGEGGGGGEAEKTAGQSRSEQHRLQTIEKSGRASSPAG